MGLLKFWDMDNVLECTVESALKNFHITKNATPERDCHYWLAATFAGRRGYRPGHDVGPIVPFTRTSMFSVLSGDSARVALGYFFFLNEIPGEALRVGKPLMQLVNPAVQLCLGANLLHSGSA